MSTLYTGIDQVSNASTTYNGVYYHMVSYLNKGDNRVETVLYTRQEHGQPVELGRYVVDSVAAGELIDCPKILAIDGMFVIHWITADNPYSVDGAPANPALHRALFDVTDPEAGWDDQGSVSIYSHLLYDARRIDGSNEFVVARKGASNSFLVARYESPFSWVDTVWATTINETIAPRILGVYGNEDDNDIIVSWERDASHLLFSAHLDADDGTAAGPVQSLDFPQDSGYEDEQNAYFYQVSHVRTAANEVALCVEAAPIDEHGRGAPYNRMHWVVHRHLNSSTGAPDGEEHATPNLCMGSHLWSWERGGVSVEGNDIYGLFTHSGARDPGSMSYASAWVMTLHEHLWDGNTSLKAIRPHAVANINSVGVPDGRFSADSPGGTAGTPATQFSNTPMRRMNHLSEIANPQPTGPLRKAKHIGAVTYARLEAVHGTDGTMNVSEAWPAGASAVVYNFIHEDPWHMPHEDVEGAIERENFFMPYAYPMHQSVEAGRSLLIAGGSPSLYDGSQVVEAGFPWRPEILAAESFDANEAGPTSGDDIYYQYYAVYKWTDAQGQTHRSAPSNIFTHQHSTEGAEGESWVSLTVRCVNVSLKGDDVHCTLPQPIEVELYRTPRFVLADAIAAGEVTEFPSGGLFYRVYGSNTPTSVFKPEYVRVNNAEALYIAVNDGVDDDALVWQGVGPYQLSEGGFIPVPPQQPPAMSVCALWRNRVFMSTGEDDNTIWYSREIQLDQGSDFYRALEFNDQNTFRIEGVERITGMAAGIGEGLVVFTTDSIEYLTGDGNDATGVGATYQMRTLHADVGCINPRSVVLTPGGIMFQSYKGLYMLNGGLALDFLGAGASIDETIREAGNIQAATLLEDRHQIRLVANGRRLFQVVWTFVIGDAAAGTWTVTGLSSNASTVSVGGANTSSIAASLANAIEAVADERVADVTVNTNTITVTMHPANSGPTLLGLHSSSGVISTSSAETYVPDPIVILHDYLTDVWAVCDIPSVEEGFDVAVGGCGWRGVDGGLVHVLVHEAGVRIEKGVHEDDLYVDDPDSPVLIDITTAWMHLTGLSNAARIRRMFVETRRTDTGPMTIVVEYDKDGTFDGDEPAPSTHSFASPAPGSLRVCPRVQKPNALRVRVYEPAGASGGRVKLLGLSLQIPPKTAGVGRRSPAQRS